MSFTHHIYTHTRKDHVSKVKSVKELAQKSTKFCHLAYAKKIEEFGFRIFIANRFIMRYTFETWHGTWTKVASVSEAFHKNSAGNWRRPKPSNAPRFTRKIQPCEALKFKGFLTTILNAWDFLGGAARGPQFSKCNHLIWYCLMVQKSGDSNQLRLVVSPII